MKKKYFSIIVFSMISLNLIFAQTKSLKGTWVLDKAEIVSIDNPNEKLQNEDSFFSSYISKENSLQVSDQYFPVSLGGDVFNYTYKLNKDELVLEMKNTVYVKKGTEEPKTVNKMGSTTFNYLLQKKQLTLYRTNNTYKEKYIFNLVK